MRGNGTVPVDHENPAPAHEQAIEQPEVITIDSGETTSAENDDQPDFDVISIDSEEPIPSHDDRTEDDDNDGDWRPTDDDSNGSTVSSEETTPNNVGSNDDSVMVVDDVNSQVQIINDNESVADSDDTMELDDDQIFNWSIAAAENRQELEPYRRISQGLTVAPLLIQIRNERSVSFQEYPKLGTAGSLMHSLAVITNGVASRENPPYPVPDPSKDVRQLLQELIIKLYMVMEKLIHRRKASANRVVRTLSQLLFVQSRLENRPLSPRPRRSSVEFQNSVPQDMSRSLLARINMASNEVNCEFCRYDDCVPPMANSSGPIRFSSELTSPDNNASQICRRCYSLRVAIITHAHHGNWYHWKQNPPADQQPTNRSSSERVVFDDPRYPVSRKLNNPICDICTRTCSSRCYGCPLIVCGDCEGLLSHACNGKIDELIQTIGKSKIRVDACLLSTAPASDWFSDWQKDPEMDPKESHFLDATAWMEDYD